MARLHSWIGWLLYSVSHQKGHVRTGGHRSEVSPVIGTFGHLPKRLSCGEHHVGIASVLLMIIDVFDGLRIAGSCQLEMKGEGPSFTTCRIVIHAESRYSCTLAD